MTESSALRAIIFDFGGVLIKTQDRRPRHIWDERLGLAHGTAESIVHASPIWYKAELGEVSVADYWQEVARQLGVGQDDLPQLIEDYFSQDRLDPELFDLIRRLRAAGHTTALLSNASLSLAEELEQREIADLFDPLVISAQIGVMKPDARAYQAVLDRLGRPADEAIFIDDMPENIEAARALGIHGVHYQAGMNLAAALSPLLVIDQDTDKL